MEKFIRLRIKNNINDNTVLLADEPGYSSRILKIGDGVTPWIDLPGITGDISLGNGEGANSLIQINDYALGEGDPPINGTWQNQAKTPDSIVIGTGSLADGTGKRGYIFGNQCTLNGNFRDHFMFGQSNLGTSSGSLTGGNSNKNYGHYNMVGGQNNTTDAYASLIIGGSNTIEDGLSTNGGCYVIGGQFNKVYVGSRGYSAIFGRLNEIKSGTSSCICGEKNIIEVNSTGYINLYGYNNIVSGTYITVSGGANKITTGTHVAIFGNSNTLANNQSSFIAGGANVSSGGGRYHFIIGSNNEALGNANSEWQFLIGLGLKTQQQKQVIVGTYNVETLAGFIVGNGTSTKRSNAFEVYKDGRAKVYGTPKETNDVVRLGDLSNYLKTDVGATKAYVDEKTQIINTTINQDYFNSLYY